MTEDQVKSEETKDETSETKKECTGSVSGGILDMLFGDHDKEEPAPAPEQAPVVPEAPAIPTTEG